MEITFGALTFKIDNNKITLFDKPFVEVHIAGENKDTHAGNKMIYSSEGRRLSYKSHILKRDSLEIEQKSDLISVKTILRKYPNTNAISAYNVIKNISDDCIILEEMSSFVIPKILNGLDTVKNTFIYRFTQSHHGECQPRKFSLFELGLFKNNPISQKRIFGCNVGSWSTKEELPQGIIYSNDCYLMFQLESNSNWYWEISDLDNNLYLYLGGVNLPFNNWCKKLNPNDSYSSTPCAFCFGNNLNDVLSEMTVYRRYICGRCFPDNSLPVIFNEYMHLSWDSPDEVRTKKLVPKIAELGVDYYVIDCGWHNEEDGNVVYPYVGQWKQSNKRFPHGIKSIIDYIHSYGMKAGLWIEPEIVGYKCKDMLDFYDDDCFIKRFGKKICVQGRYFLDFRNDKVIKYLNDTIKKMVVDYGADYIKLDYNQDLGVGTDCDSDSFGEGLEQCSKAYLIWVDNLRRQFGNVIFETCSSGGMRMDYETLKHFSIVSTSDQTDYKLYPYIAGNILSAVLPEQAAVWSYPVDLKLPIGTVKDPTMQWVDENVTDEQVVINMVNSLLGRMHLASRVNLLNDTRKNLVKEGIDYFKYLSNKKVDGYPFFPFGFTEFGKENVACGIINKNVIYLGVWNLCGDKTLEIPIQRKIVSVKVGYPKTMETNYRFNEEKLFVDFSCEYQARLFEIEVEK